MKQAENFRVREFVKKIESHPHRQALQADLQQNNAYNPFSDESKAMIREMCNVELFELCEAIPKVQFSECLLESRNSLLHLWTSLERKRIQPTFSPMATGCFINPEFTSSKRSDFVVLGTPKQRHRKSISLSTMRGGDVPQRILMEFSIVSNEIRYIMIRNSELAGPTRSASQDKSAQENHSYCPSSEECERYRKNWYISLNKSGRNAPMKLRSDFREAVTSLHRLHRESGEECPEPIPSYQYQRWHSSSSSSTTSRWQWDENWWSSQLIFCCSKIVYS